METLRLNPRTEIEYRHRDEALGCLPKLVEVIPFVYYPYHISNVVDVRTCYPPSQLWDITLDLLSVKH